MLRGYEIGGGMEGKIKERRRRRKGKIKDRVIWKIKEEEKKMVEKKSRGENEKKMRISGGEWSRKQEKLRNWSKKKEKKRRNFS